MPRYRLLIEYDGTPFAGWQIQATGISVQGVLAAAIEAFCGERAHVQGAGRTDAGVHALGQVAHVDLAKEPDPETVRDAIAATEFDTFFGPIKFDGSGRNIAKPMMLTQVQGGKYVVVGPEKWATAKPIVPRPHQ